MPMNRHLVAGMLGLALAGCAQSRSAMPNQGATSPGPVGLTTFPSIHDSINRENPQVDPVALRAGVVTNADRGGTTTVCVDNRAGVATARPGPAPARGLSAPAIAAAQPPAPPFQPGSPDPRANADASAPTPPPPDAPAGPAPIQLEHVDPPGMTAPPPPSEAPATRADTGPPPPAGS